MVKRRAVAYAIYAFAPLVGLTAAHGEPDGQSHEGNHDHDSEHRQHDVHVHGAWEMFAALDDDQLSVTVKGPLVDLVGFESAPETDEERASLSALTKRLEKPETMVALDKPARCALSAPAVVTLPEGYVLASADEEDHDHDDHEGHDHDDHDEHDHDEHDHDEHDHDEHDHDDQDGHDDEHGDDHANHEVRHSDIELTYVFDCDKPARLEAITVTGFASFPKMETVEAVFLSDSAQTARRLEPNTKTLQID